MKRWRITQSTANPFTDDEVAQLEAALAELGGDGAAVAEAVDEIAQALVRARPLLPAMPATATASPVHQDLRRVVETGDPADAATAAAQDALTLAVGADTRPGAYRRAARGLVQFVASAHGREAVPAPLVRVVEAVEGVHLRLTGASLRRMEKAPVTECARRAHRASLAVVAAALAPLKRWGAPNMPLTESSYVRLVRRGMPTA